MREVFDILRWLNILVPEYYTPFWKVDKYDGDANQFYRFISQENKKKHASRKIELFQRLRNNCYVKVAYFTSLKHLSHRHTLLSRVTESSSLPAVVYYLRNSMTASPKMQNTDCQTYLKAERTDYC
jgi:hypothetical protein